MKAVTVQQNQAHVTSWQDRMGNQGAFGEESYVLDIGQKMAAEVYSNYEVRIRDGALVHQGLPGCHPEGDLRCNGDSKRHPGNETN